MRCESTKTVPAVRGQKGKDGKPLMVKIACNMRGEHMAHANEVDGKGQPIRGTWTD